MPHEIQLGRLTCWSRAQLPTNPAVLPGPHWHQLLYLQKDGSSLLLLPVSSPVFLLVVPPGLLLLLSFSFSILALAWTLRWLHFSLRVLCSLVLLLAWLLFLWLLAGAGRHHGRRLLDWWRQLGHLSDWGLQSALSCLSLVPFQALSFVQELNSGSFALLWVGWDCFLALP